MVKARIKAFIIATISLFTKVRFGRRYRAQLDMKWRRHRLLVGALRLLFDVRISPDGSLWIELRRNIHRREAKRHLRRLRHQARPHPNRPPTIA